MKNIPSFLLELLTSINIFFENINLKRIGSYLLEGRVKNNMKALAENRRMGNPLRFGLNRYA